MLREKNEQESQFKLLEFESYANIPSDASCEPIQQILPEEAAIEEWGGSDWTVLKIRCHENHVDEIRGWNVRI